MASGMLGRRDLVKLAAASVGAASAMAKKGGTAIVLPDLPCAAELPEVVLFGFDDRAFPFRNESEIRLIPGQAPKLVLRHGETGVGRRGAPLLWLRDSHRRHVPYVVHGQLRPAAEPHRV